MKLSSLMQTITGKVIDFTDPKPDMFDILDIATGLSRECRFAGQGSHFYSVAQHSVLVSRFVKPGFELEALLHDASEAYLKDIPKPLKHLLPCYVERESAFEDAIRVRFDLPRQQSVEVKQADDLMSKAELRDLFPEERDLSEIENQGLIPKKIFFLSPEFAKDQFLSRFALLTKGRV